MNKCPKCGTEYEGQWCPECEEKQQKEKTCPHCKASLYEGAKFCPHCGYSFVPPKKAIIANWLKAHKKLVIALSVLLMVLIILSTALPVGLVNRYNGTYYLYQYEEYMQDEYFTLKGGKWENALGEKGNYKVNGGTITLSQNVFGQTVTISSGTIKKGVMTLNVLGAEMVYAKKGAGPHTHSSTEWQSDLTHHWHVCTKCGKEFDKAKHVGNGTCEICNVILPDSQGFFYTLNQELGGLIVMGNTNPTGDIIIPENYLGFPILGIGERAFKNCTKLTSVVIPDSVVSIDYAAFVNCSDLTSVTFGNAVSYIGQFAFDNCSGITGIELPESMTWIDDYAFRNCSGLTSITIPDNVTIVGGHAFYNCSSLTSAIIGRNVTSIEESAFKDCSSLTSVVLPDSVASIKPYAFYGCRALTNVYYQGAAEEWKNISISNFAFLTSTTRYYYSETAPTEEGNYWHYDADMVPTPWVKEN